MLISVDLPAPLGAEQAEDLPAGRVEADLVERASLGGLPLDR